MGKATIAGRAACRFLQEKIIHYNHHGLYGLITTAIF